MSKERFYILHGYGGENSLMPLLQFLQEKGESVLMIDDQRFPYDRIALHDRLLEIRSQYDIVLVSSAHIWFDYRNYLPLYGDDRNMISVLELIDLLHPVRSVYYPHDMECFLHESEMRWLDLFDIVLLPYRHNMYYKLKHISRHVEVIGWIKKDRIVTPPVDLSCPVYRPVFFPSSIISFYNQLGVEGYADWFRRYTGPDIPIKMPSGDTGITTVLSAEGYQLVDTSKSVYDVMSEANLIIGSGDSSIIFEAAFSGIPVISVLDGMLPDEDYLKRIRGIQGVYPMHPEDVLPFIQKINKEHILLDAGPDILAPFDFEKVYAYLKE